jgi:hypothetical protein
VSVLRQMASHMYGSRHAGASVATGGGGASGGAAAATATAAASAAAAAAVSAGVVDTTAVTTTTDGAAVDSLPTSVAEQSLFSQLPPRYRVQVQVGALLDLLPKTASIPRKTVYLSSLANICLSQQLHAMHMKLPLSFTCTHYFHPYTFNVHFLQGKRSSCTRRFTRYTTSCTWQPSWSAKTACCARPSSCAR